MIFFSTLGSFVVMHIQFAILQIGCQCLALCGYVFFNPVPVVGCELTSNPLVAWLYLVNVNI